MAIFRAICVLFFVGGGFLCVNQHWSVQSIGLIIGIVSAFLFALTFIPGAVTIEFKDRK